MGIDRVKKALKNVTVEERANPPSLEELIEQTWEGRCEATDGCVLPEEDGICPHGKPSWLLVLGLI